MCTCIVKTFLLHLKGQIKIDINTVLCREWMHSQDCLVFETAKHSGPDFWCIACSQPALVLPWSVPAVIWLVALCKRLPPALLWKGREVLPPSSMSCLVNVYSSLSLRTPAAASQPQEVSSAAPQQNRELSWEHSPCQPPLVQLSFCLAGWDHVEDHPCPSK